MQLPPNLQRALLSANCGAANVGTARALLPAVAGKRYRLWHYTFATVVTSQAPTNIRGQVINPGGAVAYFIVAFAGFGSQERTSPGGIVTPTNEAVEVFDQSAVAGVTITHLLYYTDDDT